MKSKKIKEAVGVSCIGIERYPEYYEMSCLAIPKLAALDISNQKNDLKKPIEEIETMTTIIARQGINSLSHSESPLKRTGKQY